MKTLLTFAWFVILAFYLFIGVAFLFNPVNFSNSTVHLCVFVVWACILTFITYNIYNTRKNS